jgi:Fe-S cluster assembly iron-binding protein IscA
MARTKGLLIVLYTDNRTGEKAAYKSLPAICEKLKLEDHKVRYACKTYGCYETRKYTIEYVKLIKKTDDKN